MSENETKIATGRCAEVIEKGDWTTFAIDVGRQYPIKLSTKLEPLIELGRAAWKDGGAFDWTYSESQGGANPHKPGTFYTNRYLSGVEPAGSVATPAAASRDAAEAIKTVAHAAVMKSGGDAMNKDDWGRKDSAIHMMAAIKAAAAALQHTMPADPSTEDLQRFVERVKYLSYNWWKRADAVRKGDESDVPFLTEHDDQIPY